jgi:cell division protein FtsB
MRVARILTVGVAVAGVVFAVTGGRYSLADYRRVRAEDRLLMARIDSLTAEIDSLTAFRDSLRRDPRVQERVARARSGMIRPGEIAVLIVPEAAPPDTTDPE